MPMYEFECKGCRHTFSKVMRVAEIDSAAPQCPLCNGRDIVQLMEPTFVRTARKA